MLKMSISRPILLKLRKEGLPCYTNPLRFDPEKVIEWLDKREIEKQGESSGKK